MHDLGFVSPGASALAFVFLVSGCMQSRVDESRELQTQIQKNEAVVILAKPQVEGASAEDQFMHCVAAELTGPDRAIATRTDEQFTDALFPWFEPGTAPTKPEGVAALLTRPGVAERVAESGVRYIVWLDGGTQKTDGGGSLACGASPGVAGCIGFGWWEKESHYEATIWDLKQAKSAGSQDQVSPLQRAVTERGAGGESVVVAHQPGEVRPERHDTGAGQGREVEDRVRLKSQTKAERIGEGQAAFRVRVVDLHRLAVERAEHIAELVRRSRRHVLGTGGERVQLDR